MWPLEALCYFSFVRGQVVSVFSIMEMRTVLVGWLAIGDLLVIVCSFSKEENIHHKNKKRQRGKHHMSKRNCRRLW